MANYSQESRSCVRDTNLIASEMDYVGTIQEILEVNFRIFKFWIFDVKWFKVMCKGDHATIKKNPSVFLQLIQQKFGVTKLIYLFFPCTVRK